MNSTSSAMSGCRTGPSSGRRHGCSRSESSRWTGPGAGRSSSAAALDCLLSPPHSLASMSRQPTTTRTRHASPASTSGRTPKSRSRRWWSTGARCLPSSASMTWCSHPTCCMSARMVSWSPVRLLMCSLADGVAIVADPGRVGREPFLEALAGHGLRIRSQYDIAYVDGAIRQTITCFEVECARDGSQKLPVP